MQQQFVRYQAEHHPLVQTDEFDSIEAYCLHLIHLKAYEEVATLTLGKTVLDLGCNNGYGTRIIAKAASSAVGVDVSENALFEARRQQVEKNISFVSVDGGRLPFEDREFDVICSCQVIEHVSEYQPYLSEIMRVLKDDGVALFTTPNGRIRLDPGMKPWFPFHVREFSGDELRDLLKKWFSHVQVKGLFATKELYQIERDRVQRSRDAARRRSKAFFPPYSEVRAKAINAVKALLPAQAVKAIQHGLRKSAAVLSNSRNPAHGVRPAADATLLGRFSTQDLYYSEADIAEALDLLAVCRKLDLP